MENNIINLNKTYQYFLRELATTKNKKYYDALNYEQKINPTTLKTIIANFSDVDFILECYDFLESNNKNISDEDRTAITIMLGEIYKLTEDERLEEFYDMACSFFRSVLETIDIEVDKAIDEDEEAPFDRFEYIKMMYKDPYIRLQFVNTLLDDIFFNDEFYESIDELVHCEVNNPNEITDKKTFILDFLYDIGEFSLADYLRENSDFTFMNFLYGKIDDVLDTWDSYMIKLNKERINFIYWKCQDYGKKNKLPFNYLFIVKDILEKKKDKNLLKEFKVMFENVENNNIYNISEKKFEKYIENYIDNLLEDDTMNCEFYHESDFEEEIIDDKKYIDDTEKQDANSKTTNDEPCKIIKLDLYRKK